MLEFLKTKGVWLVAAVLCVSAIVFIFVPYAQKARKTQIAQTSLESQKGQLNKLSLLKEIPNSSWIDKGQTVAQDVQKRFEASKLFFANQRHVCQSRRFYTDEFGMAREPIKGSLQWLGRYETEFQAMRAELAALATAGGGAAWLPKPMTVWGSRLPQDVEITTAMLEFWLQKDLADLLSNSEPKDLDNYLSRQIPEVGTGFNLIRNGNPKEPVAALLRLVSDKHLTEQQLRTILKQILVGAQGGNLANLLSAYVLTATPGAPPETVWTTVQAVTTDRSQLGALERLQNDNDWSNLYSFAMDLKTVRFRNDLTGLLGNHKAENPRFGHLITLIEETDPREQASQLNQIDLPKDNRPPDWSLQSVAEAISCLLVVANREDYDLLVKNHGTPPVRVDRLMLSAQRPQARVYVAPRLEMMDERLSGQTVAIPLGGVKDLYYSIGLDLSVRLGFQDIPQLIRRLSSSDWCISIDDFSMTILAGSLAVPSAAGAEEKAFSELTAPEGGAEGIQVRRGETLPVLVTMRCQARSFLPLYLSKFAPKPSAKPPAPAAAKAAAPPGPPAPAPVK